MVVTNNSPSQHSNQPDDLFQSRHNNNMKKTWAETNEVMNQSKLKSKPSAALRRLNCDEITHNPTEFSDVLNDFFSSVGQNLAAKVPNSNGHLSEYVLNIKHLLYRSFFFKPVTVLEIKIKSRSFRPIRLMGLILAPFVH